MFRSIEQMQDLGGIYLHSMPCRYEDKSEFLEELNNKKIDKIICLVSDDEINQKSPDYMAIIKNNELGVERF
ncbi:MAG: hypothetical protein U9Q83_09520 [Bacteroidota bacterium]|nr:hypothetical protein [Bacteroidota bacterium]